MKSNDLALRDRRLTALAQRVEKFRASKTSRRPRYPKDIQREVGELAKLGVKIGDMGRVLKVSFGAIQNWIESSEGATIHRPPKATKENEGVRELTLVSSSMPSPEPVRIRFSNQVVIEIPVGAVNAEFIRALVLSGDACW